MNEIIRIENLTHTYGEGTPFRRSAVENLSLDIYRGEFLGLIGHTGSGKSTLIQHLNGLLKPTGGRVLLDGEDIWADPKKIRSVRFRVGLVFQYPEHQLFENDVLSDVCFGPMNQGLSREEAEVEAKKALQHVGFKEKNYSKSPFELSGGQKKRVAIAGVLAMNPKILILDEATSSVDILTEMRIQRAFRNMMRGKTTFIIAHRLSTIREADVILVMNQGHVVEQGTHQELLAKGGFYANLYNSQFVRTEEPA